MSNATDGRWVCHCPIPVRRWTLPVTCNSITLWACTWPVHLLAGIVIRCSRCTDLLARVSCCQLSEKKTIQLVCDIQLRSWESHLLPDPTAFKILIIIDFLIALAALLTAVMKAPFSTAPSTKWLSIRIPDNNLNKLKFKKPRENYSTVNLNDYDDDLSDVEWEFAQLIVSE